MRTPPPRILTFGANSLSPMTSLSTPSVLKLSNVFFHSPDGSYQKTRRYRWKQRFRLSWMRLSDMVGYFWDPWA